MRDEDRRRCYTCDEPEPCGCEEHCELESLVKTPEGSSFVPSAFGGGIDVDAARDYLEADLGELDNLHRQDHNRIMGEIRDSARLYFHAVKPRVAA